MRAARLDMLSAAVCKLRKLFDCCESCGDTELLMLEIDSGRGCCCCGSLWRVRITDNFRRMTLPSERKDLRGCCFCCCEPGGGVTPAREMDELECVGSGESDARDERLNGDKTLYATGGCVGECVGEDCDAAANGDCGSCGELVRSRSRLPRDELAPSPSDAGASTGGGKRVKISAGLLPRSANCACMSSLDRKSHVGGARPAHLECAMRLQWEHSTAPFFTGSIHTRQLTARYNQSLAMATGIYAIKMNARLLKVVFTKVCSRMSKRSGSACGTSGMLPGDALANETWPGELESTTSSAPPPMRANSETGDDASTGSRLAIKWRAASFFCKSALTRRRNGMLS
jgi:hypothetical protein